MSYALTPEAAAELADAAAFCRNHFGPVAAENLLATFEAKVRLIGDFPGVGSAMSNGRRLYPIGRYPFSILYRFEDGIVRISAIAHHGRKPAYWQKRPT